MTAALQVADLCRIFEAVFGRVVEEGDLHDVKALPTWIECVFVFALIWSVGACVSLAGRSKFSTRLRQLLASDASAAAPAEGAVAGKGSAKASSAVPATNKLSKPFPEDHSVFDYVYSPRQHWIHWMNSTTLPGIPERAQFHEIIVPTIDTVRHTYLLDVLLRQGTPMLLGGATGTGKTATVTSHLMGGLDTKAWEPLIMNFRSVSGLAVSAHNRLLKSFWATIAARQIGCQQRC